MYLTRANSAKQQYQFSDFPHAESIETWLRPQTIKEYLINYAKRFDLYNNMKVSICLSQVFQLTKSK